MLGRFNKDLSEISYNRVAGDEYSFYELDNWNSLYSLVDENFEQKINEQFIEKQFSLGKQFFFSHNPNNPQGMSYPLEIELLKEIVKREFNTNVKFKPAGKYWILTW